MRTKEPRPLSPAEIARQRKLDDRMNAALERLASHVPAEEFDFEEKPEKPARIPWLEVGAEICPPKYLESDLSHKGLDIGLLEWFRSIEPREEDWRGLGIMGPSGKGKTRILFCHARALYELGVNVLYVTHSDLVVAVGKAFSSGDRMVRTREERRIERWRSVRLLVLDDIASGANSPRATEQLLSLLEHRTANGLPTCWSSEYSSKGLESYFGTGLGERGKAIVRRLVQDTFTQTYSIP